MLPGLVDELTQTALLVAWLNDSAWKPSGSPGMSMTIRQEGQNLSEHPASHSNVHGRASRSSQEPDYQEASGQNSRFQQKHTSKHGVSGKKASTARGKLQFSGPCNALRSSLRGSLFCTRPPGCFPQHLSCQRAKESRSQVFRLGLRILKCV